MQNTTKLKLIGFLKGLYFYVPVFTLYFLDAGVTLPQIIFSQVFFSFMSVLGEIPTGILADKYGQKYALLAGYFLDALGIAMLLVFPSAITLYIAFGLRGISNSFLSGAEEALFYESHKAEKSKNSYQKDFGTFNANDAAGFLLATLFAGFAVQFFGKVAYQPLIAANALAIVITFFIALTLKNLKGAENIANQQVNALKHFAKSVAFIKNEKVVFGLTIISILTLNAEYFLKQVYQPLFENAGAEPIFLGVALATGAGFHILVVKHVYILERYFSLPKILLILNGITGIFYLLMGLIVGPAVSVILFILLMGSFGAHKPIISDYVNERIDSSQRTTVLSTISLVTTFFDMISRLLLGIIVGVIGINLTLILQGGYMIVGILAGYYILVKCGCIYRIKTHVAKVVEDEIAAG